MTHAGKRIIVVLGMHRSGTSAITCGLSVLGVALGERLNPPAKGDNEKGFFEDLDILELNIQLLNELKSDWHSLAPLDSRELDRLCSTDYLFQAVELIRQKTQNVSIYGFKDPRVAKLIPFWSRVFTHCGFEVSYVLAVRNPLSVAQSLAKRDNFSREKSYILWLGHVLSSLVNTEKQTRIVVDYDQFMHNPQHAFELIARQLKLAVNSQALQEYLTDFLEEDLRHTVYTAEDLVADTACPPLVQDVYCRLLETSLSCNDLERPEFQELTLHWAREFERSKSSLHWIDGLFKQIEQLKKEAVEQKSSFTQQLSEMEQGHVQQILELNSQHSEREQALHQELLQELSDKEKEYSKQLLKVQEINIQQLRKQDHQHTESIQELISQFDAKQQELNGLLLHWREEGKALERSLSIANNKIINFSDQNTALNKELTAAVSTNIKLNCKIETIESDHTELTRKTNELQREISLANSEYKSLHANFVALGGEYESAVTNSTRLKNELEALQDQHAQIINERDVAMTNGLHHKKELDSIIDSLFWRKTSSLRRLLNFCGAGCPDSNISSPATACITQPDSLPPEPSKSRSNNCHRITNMAHTHTVIAAETVDELLSHNDIPFIHCAYTTLLGREPDEAGRAYYLARLRSGISKFEILAQISLSAEGMRKKNRVTGLDKIIQRHKLLKSPLLGTILRLAGLKQIGEGAQQQLRAIENRLSAIDSHMHQRFDEMSSVLQQLSHTLHENDQLTTLNQVRQALSARKSEPLDSSDRGSQRNRRHKPEHASPPDVTDTPSPFSEKKLTKILWIVNGSDIQTQKYRVYNYSEELAKLGIQSEIMNETQLDGIQPGRFDIVVFNRIAESQSSRTLIDNCKAAGVPVVFDIDDLVFDPERIELLRFYSGLEEAQQKQLNKGFERWRESLLSCDAVTTSTFALSAEARKLGLPAFVLPNTIGSADLRMASEREAPSKTGGNRIRIGYFSGTKTHQEDFSSCISALDRILGEVSDAELLVVGHLDIPQELLKYGNRIITLPLMSHSEMLIQLATVDINLVPLELDNAFTDCKSELKIFEAALYGIPSIVSPTSTFSAVIAHGENGLLAASPEDWYTCIRHLVTDSSDRARLGQRAKELHTRRFSITTAVKEAQALFTSLINHRTPQNNSLAISEHVSDTTAPLVTVVAVLYGKQNEVGYFLESLRRQEFAGAFEVLLVNDQSPDNSVDVVENYLRAMNRAQQFAALMDVRIISNPDNRGNCASRNRAISEAAGELIVVVDADCMLNRTYLQEHYQAFLRGDSDVGIGPMNIETMGADPYSVLGQHEADCSLRMSQAQLQDPTNPDSFVNCITRNFSISRKFLGTKLSGLLFNELFGYSADPNSGFGWEDVEMGCRLYKAGARIRFLSETFSIHVSHPPTTDEGKKAFRSLKNFRRLHEIHPDLVLLSRQWGIRTYQAIVNWTGTSHSELSKNDDYNYLEGVFDRYRRSPIIVQQQRPLRILTYRWHCSHQYELYRSGHEFTLVTGTGTGLCESWEWDKRPMPTNAAFARFEDINPNNYDLAILHFDENALHPERCHGKVPGDWGTTLQWFLRNVNLPKVAICHGTPQFAGQYNANYHEPDLGSVYEDSRKELVELFQDILVVCNSHQAQHEWGFINSTVVWHGFAPHEYPQGAGDQGILTMVSAALENRPHYNGLFIYNRVKELLGDAFDISALRVPAPQQNYVTGTREWAEAKFRNYSREIGRYSVYLNPTLRSPMPRSRGEAMMAGLVSVNMRNHDVDMFIRNGANGFFADSAEEIADQLLFLQRNDATKKKMAAASRHTALDIFNQDRYLAHWANIFKQVAG